jgi:two-component system, OmpR family, sensor histidine kinase KdpD
MAAPLRREYGFAVASVAVSSAVCFAMYPRFELTNLVMVYLLGTLAVAARGHRGPAAFSSLASVLCFDFFFVPPRFTFTVSDAQYIWTFAVMFAVAMIISHLTVRLREEAQAARQEEQRSAWLMEKAKHAEVAAETERLRSSLLSSVSHDFRTPLTAIVGSVGALLEKEEIRKDPASRELLENIEEEGQRLSRLVQNLLEVTRLESGAVQIQKELVPLEEVVGSALERIEKSLHGKSVNVNLPDDLPLVPMDAMLIEQVLINLLENGIRHTPTQTPLEISARLQEGAVSVTVSDRGRGLMEEELEHVFDKFYHDKASLGAGLGLAICRAVVTVHGGLIKAENRPGGGAIFEFTLPLQEKGIAKD